MRTVCESLATAVHIPTYAHLSLLFSSKLFTWIWYIWYNLGKVFYIKGLTLYQMMYQMMYQIENAIRVRCR